jgi:hypothetical protein
MTSLSSAGIAWVVIHRHMCTKTQGCGDGPRHQLICTGATEWRGTDPSLTNSYVEPRG